MQDLDNLISEDPSKRLTGLMVLLQILNTSNAHLAKIDSVLEQNQQMALADMERNRNMEQRQIKIEKAVEEQTITQRTAINIIKWILATGVGAVVTAAGAAVYLVKQVNYITEPPSVVKVIKPGQEE